MNDDFCHEVLAPEALGATDRASMFELFSSCYDQVTRGCFDADLADKTSVIVMRDGLGEVRGFSTQQVYEHATEAGMIQVLFSGDTVVDPRCWGRSELVRGWCEVAARAMLNAPDRQLYWFLISKGHRTYRYLPVFFRQYVPGIAPGVPAAWFSLLHALARERFGRAYDAGSGLIRFDGSRGHLTPALAGVPAGRRDDPHVKFFLERNPDYARGVELACLAEITLANTHGLGRRWLGEALAQAAASSMS